MDTFDYVCLGERRPNPHLCEAVQNISSARCISCKVWLKKKNPQTFLGWLCIDFMNKAILLAFVFFFRCMYKYVFLEYAYMYMPVYLCMGFLLFNCRISRVHRFQMSDACVSDISSESDLQMFK